MNQKIGLKVSATLDTSAVEQNVNALGQKIAQANRVQYQPVTAKTVEDVKKLNAALNETVKTQAGLRRRLKDTGQSDTPFTDWDWKRLYPHAASRGVAMQNVFERVVGAGSFSGAPSPTPGGGGQKPGNSWGNVAAGVAQAGLRATGPAGGVAAGAVGTGMSSGFGAGLMGLVGGLAALGIGKAVGAVMEKVDQAERNHVEYDKLKRILGDVGVSFGALKGVVHTSAENLKITYEEAARLSTQFTKLANLSGDQYKTLNDELDTGVGLSRSLGLDPSAGVGLLGQMRGVGVTSNTQETRRFALLIGETIGKSNAFAKAEEVFEAIGGYATSQTRSSMGGANVEGYAGMFSAMVGSGIPGLDPAGSAGLLSKINATLAAGGAKGEASQFFSGIVGHRMGLDPIQTQILREGGAFATNDEAFGEKSIAAKFGIAGPGGSKTFLQGSLDELRSQYGNNKGLLAQATANHLGIGMRQAMALLSVEPNKMGEMEQYAGDLTKMTGSGITNLSKALYGTSDERRALADDFLARRGDRAITKEDRAALEGAKGDDELKRALASMAAKYDQERTTGSDIRDSKNSLDNIKTDLAGKLIPVAQEMRHGIMLLAGGGKKSPQEIMKEVMELESKDRINNIKGQFGAKADPLNDRLDRLRSKERSLDPSALAHTYRDKPEILDAKLKERAEVQREIIEIEGKLKKLSEEKAAALKDENDEQAKRLRALKTGGVAPEESGGSVPERKAGGGRGFVNPSSGSRHGSAPAGAGGSDEFDALFVKYGKQYGVDPALLKTIAMKESNMNPGAVSKANNNGTRDFGLMQHNSKFLAERGLAEDWQNPERSIEEAAKLLASNIRRGGSVRTGVRMYNGSGPMAEAYANDVMSKLGGTKISDGSIPGGARNLGAGTPAASVGMQNESSYKPGAVTSAPLPPLTGEASVTVDLSPEAKRMLAAPATPLAMKVGPATPLGAKSPGTVRQ